MPRRSPRLRLAAVALVAATLVTGAAGAQAAPATNGKPPVRLVVLFDRLASAVQQDRLLAGAGTELRTVAALRARVIEVPGPRARDVVRKLRASGSVRSVELDAVRTIAAIPNDAVGSSLGQVDLPAAWEYTTGSPSTVIAIVDTGVDPVAPDLPRSRFVAPFNVLTGTANVGDVEGHGTAVASIAAGTGNNGRQAAGVCWSCSIMPVKALDSDGTGSASDVATGIVWAVDHGADVVNLSLSGSRSGVEKAAIDYAESHGVVVVAAAGNQGSSTPRYPAAHPTVLGVAASGIDNDARAPYSNLGSWVKLAAPGTNVALDSDNANGLLNMPGTSAASPLVAGIVGLLRSENPGLSPVQVRSALMDSAVDVPYVASAGGRVDADGALAAIGGGLTAPPGPTTGPAPFLEPSLTDEGGGGPTSSGMITKTLTGVRAGSVLVRGSCAFCGTTTVEILTIGGAVVASQTAAHHPVLAADIPSDGTYRFRVRGQRGGIAKLLITYNQ